MGKIYFSSCSFLNQHFSSSIYSDSHYNNSSKMCVENKYFKWRHLKWYSKPGVDHVLCLVTCPSHVYEAWHGHGGSWWDRDFVVWSQRCRQQQPDIRHWAAPGPAYREPQVKWINHQSVSKHLWWEWMA